MVKKALFLASFSFIVFVLIKMLTYSTGIESYKKSFRENYRIYSVEVPEQVDFADEPVPTDVFYVRESLEKELLINTYWQSHTLLLLKRANRWFPIIEPILKEKNIPNDFKYLAVIESELDQTMSPAGAAGFWQLIPETGKRLGLEINDEVDERYHVVKATYAACKYLHDAYAQFGNWTLAAAAYNMGTRGLANRIAEQKGQTYYDLSLNRETARYVYRIVAIKTILRNPADYGYHLRKKDLHPPVPTTSIAVDSTIHSLADFANAQGLSYKTFKELNPWLRKGTLPNASRKTYTLLLPENGNIYYEKLQQVLPDPEKIPLDTDSSGQMD